MQNLKQQQTNKLEMQKVNERNKKQMHALNVQTTKTKKQTNRIIVIDIRMFLFTMLFLTRCKSANLDFWICVYISSPVLMQ